MQWIQTILTSKLIIGVTIGLLLWQAIRLLRHRRVNVITDVKWYIPPWVWIGLTVLLLAGQVWLVAFPRQSKASAAGQPASTTQSSGATEQSLRTGAAPNASPAAAQDKPAESTRILRFILWLNLCLALPWVTAHIVRWVLGHKSNFASFVLLLGYVVIDVVIAMTIARFSFVGGLGAMKLMILLCLCAGYNYWSCEAIARMWVNSGKA